MSEHLSEPPASDELPFEQRIAQIEASLERIERSSDAVAREAARDTVATLLELHRTALGKIVSFGRARRRRTICDRGLLGR